jgi:hypothetical protein
MTSKTTKNLLPFMDGLKMMPSKIPKYHDFKGEFVQPLDYHLVKLLSECEDTRIAESSMTLFCDTVVKHVQPNGELRVKNNQRLGLGRFYGDNDITIIPQSRFFKHTLFFFLGYRDIDQVKGHPRIAAELFRIFGQPKFAIENYINHFDEVAAILIEFYSPKGQQLSKDQIKRLFNMMIYGGRFSKWRQAMHDGDARNGVAPLDIRNGDMVHPLVQAYSDDCDEIDRRLMAANKDLRAKLKKSELKPGKSEQGRLNSYYFGIIENHMLHIAYVYLVKRGIIIPRRCGLEYDGLCIPSTTVVFDEEFVIRDLNQHILMETGLGVQYKFKGYGEYVLHDVIEKRRAMVIEPIVEVVADRIANGGGDDATDERSPSEIFEGLVPEFEKTHALIVNKSAYVHETEDSTQFMTDKQLHTSYKHIPCGYTPMGAPVLFIARWMSFNSKIRKYDDADVYPNTNKCPKNIYNLWKPFAMEKYKGIPYEPNEEALGIFLHHIRILCCHDEAVFDWFVKWIAQMLQFPEVKTVIPTFISKPGTGKNTLITLLSKLMGSSKVMETTNPARDVWGDFNGMMATSFLVHLCEMSKKDYREAEGKFKSLITDPTTTINSKGMNQYAVKSYHRFIGSTNNEDPLPTADGDRRNVVIRCSDEKIGDKAYFKQLYTYLEDVNVLRTLFDYFMSIPGMDAFGEIPLPVTEFQNDLKKSNRTPIEAWLEAFTTANSHKNTVSLKSGDVFDAFTTWVAANGFQYEVNSLKFSVRLKNLNIPGITSEHTKTGGKKVFDIYQLSQHFGLALPDVRYDDLPDDATVTG